MEVRYNETSFSRICFASPLALGEIEVPLLLKNLTTYQAIRLRPALSKGQSIFNSIQTIYKRGESDCTLTFASTDLPMNARRAKQQKEEMIPFAIILKEKIHFCLQKVSFSGALLSFNSVLGFCTFEGFNYNSNTKILIIIINIII